MADEKITNDETVKIDQGITDQVTINQDAIDQGTTAQVTNNQAANQEKSKVTIEGILDSLTDEQKVAAKLLKNSCVSAGAGSGKTTVLATRYVYLVAKYGFKPSEILTLTFTNKAAAEMYKRIFSSLKDFEKRIIDEQGKKNIQNALQTFSEAKIQTLDSYCSSIIKSSVHHFGIPPTYSIDENKIVEMIEKKSLEFVLTNRENKYLQAFLGTSKTADFAKEFFAKTILSNSTLANPIDFNVCIQKQIEQNNALFLESINKVNDFTQSLKGYIDDGNKLSEKLYPLAKQLLESKYELPTIIHSNIICSEFWDWLKTFYSFIYARKASGDLGVIMENGRVLYKSLASATNFLAMQENLLGIAPLFAQFQDLVQNTKRTMGLLTFGDAADLAIKTLLEYPEIRQIEKKAYKAIMIDEFQDDNILQKNLLYLISEKVELQSENIPKVDDLEEEKLFFVGDEKQSIYRFRGADVEVFRKLSTELTNGATLSTNFRSSAALIASFNSIFGGEDYLCDVTTLCEPEHSTVFPKESAFLYEATYVNTKASPKKMLEAEYFPQKVHVALVPRYDEEPSLFSILDMQAIYVAKTIRNLIDNENVSPSDIALLFRATTNQPSYERFLRQFSIPYSSEMSKSFFYDAPVNDILALLKLIVSPKDYISFFTLLKSPFARLNEKSAVELLSIIKNLEDEKEAKFYCLCDFPALYPFLNTLSEDDIVRFGNFATNYLKLLAFSKNHTVAECVSKIWYEFGYVYETMWNQNVEPYAEFYDYLFALAQKADSQNQSLAEFLDVLEAAKNDPKKLRDLKVPLERKSAVQIMSIHASKGLEFKYVFVCDISNAGVKDSNTQKSFFSDKYGLVINLPISKKIPTKRDVKIVNMFYEESKEENIKRAKAEIKRLLYVAITRAEEKVFLVGKFLEKSEDNDKLSFFTILEPHLREYTNYNVKIDEPKDKDDNVLKADGKSENKLETCFGNTLKNSPFSEELIKPIERKDLRPIEVGVKNNDMYRNLFSEVLQDKYAKAKIIETPIIESNYRNPSHIHFEDDFACTGKTGEDKNAMNKADKTGENDTNKTCTGKIGEDKTVTLAVDSLFKKKKAENFLEVKKLVQGDPDFETIQEDDDEKSFFTEADFGTMAHACIESIFLKKEPDISANILCKLTEKQLGIAMNDAKMLAQKFMASDIGVLAQKSLYVKNEYDFKMAVKKNENVLIIDGQIDLLFLDDETKTLYVVDFKSDKKENPKNHYLQLLSYTNAAASFEKQSDFANIKTIIYYLRSGNYVDISEEIAKINLADYL